MTRLVMPFVMAWSPPTDDSQTNNTELGFFGAYLATGRDTELEDAWCPHNVPGALSREQISRIAFILLKQTAT